MEKFSYSVSDFIQERGFWNFPIWLIIAISLIQEGTTGGNWIILLVVWAIAYGLIRWKRQAFYKNKIPEWKTMKII